MKPLWGDKCHKMLHQMLHSCLLLLVQIRRWTMACFLLAAKTTSQKSGKGTGGWYDAAPGDLLSVSHAGPGVWGQKHQKSSLSCASTPRWALTFKRKKMKWHSCCLKLFYHDWFIFILDWFGNYITVIQTQCLCCNLLTLATQTINLNANKEATLQLLQPAGCWWLHPRYLKLIDGRKSF